MNNEPSIFDKMMTEITAAARRRDIAELQRLTPLAARAKALESERAELIKLIDRPNGVPSSVPFVAPTASRSRAGTRRGARGGLQVEVSLPKNGKIVLEEVTATETLMALMERLLLEFGVERLETLGAVRTGRGPLLSRSPQKDFLNPKSGQPYTHHRIPGTDSMLSRKARIQRK